MAGVEKLIACSWFVFFYTVALSFALVAVSFSVASTNGVIFHGAKAIGFYVFSAVFLE